MFAGTGPITMSLPASLRARAREPSISTSSGAAFADNNEVYRRVRDLQAALDTARGTLGSVGVGRMAGSRPVFTSEDPLAIDPTPAVSSLDSSEELNTAPYSFSPFGPSWDGGSSSLVTVGGTYDGDQGDDLLKFKATRDRTVGGSRNIRIKVYDQGGTNFLQNLNWSSWTPADTPKTLNNGLTVSLGSGDLEKNDTFWVDVSTSIDSEVDPDLAMDGTRNSDPNLELGESVTDGSFLVNGEEIAVSAGDSITEVLDRITGTVDDVTASYDASSELITLERDTAGALHIAITDDSSGFVDATKLSGATVVLGSEDGEVGLLMEEVAALAGTSAGSIMVNDTEVSFDPTTDTLADVLDRITSTVDGVTASFNEDPFEVLISSDNPTNSLTIEDQGSGLLADLDLAEGTRQGRRSSRMSQPHARKVSLAMRAVQQALQALYSTEVRDSGAQQTLAAVKASVESSITTGLGTSSEDLEDWGISFDLDSDDAEGVMSMDAGLLERSLRSDDGAEMLDLLVAPQRDRQDGLLGTLNTTVRSQHDTLRRAYGTVGIYLSTYA